MNVDQVDVRTNQLRHRRTDGPGNVVKFRVDEDADVARLAIRKNAGRIAADGLQTHLQDDVELVEAIDELLCSLRTWHVEGND